MLQPLYVLSWLLLLFSCKEANKPYNVRTDIRMNTRFYSIFLNEDGQGYVIKGKLSDSTDKLNILSSDTSKIFEIDSVKPFFYLLDRLKNHPIFGVKRTDAPRVEIYYNNQKVYDAYKWDETFWDLYKPIIYKIPKGFNPFRSDDEPFDD